MKHHYLPARRSSEVIELEVWEWRTPLMGYKRRHKIGFAGRVSRAAKNRWHAYPVNHRPGEALITARTSQHAIAKLIAQVA